MFMFNCVGTVSVGVQVLRGGCGWYSSLPCVGNHGGGYSSSSALYYSAHPFAPLAVIYCIVVHYRVGRHASRFRVGGTTILEQSLCAARRSRPGVRTYTYCLGRT